jgi:hypothetical protein
MREQSNFSVAGDGACGDTGGIIKAISNLLDKNLVP